MSTKDFDYGQLAAATKQVRCLTIALALTCCALIAAIGGGSYLLYRELDDDNTNTSCHESSTVIPNGYILDGPVWHSLFYRMTDQSGIEAANTWCLTLKNASYASLPAVSVHCGVQNSIEQVSFGAHGVAQSAANRSLEYGFALTFNSEAVKDSVIEGNALYLQFRAGMAAHQDSNSFAEQGFGGIWVFDWTHGETNRTNIRPHNATQAVAPNSTWHFCFFRFKEDAYTFHVTPTLVDNYRDLENTMVDPANETRKLATLFSFGIQSSAEELSFGPHDGTALNRSTEYGHVQSYRSFEDKEFMVGADHTARPLYDDHHDLFKAMIGGLHPNAETGEMGAFFEWNGSVAEGVFVFDFTDL